MTTIGHVLGFGFVAFFVAAVAYYTVAMIRDGRRSR